MRQCLRNCHRIENARTAPEPHLHVSEADRLHGNQICLKRRRRTLRFELWQESCRCRWPRHLRCGQGQSHQCCRLVSVAAARAWCCGSQHAETTYGYNRRYRTSQNTFVSDSRSSVVSCVDAGSAVRFLSVLCRSCSPRWLGGNGSNTNKFWRNTWMRRRSMMLGVWIINSVTEHQAPVGLYK